MLHTRGNVRRLARGPAAIAVLAMCVAALPGHVAATAATGAGGPTAAEVVPTQDETAGWPFGGRDIANTRSNPNETVIDASNAAGLATKWTIETQGEVSATPTVVDGALYFPDWAGFLTKADAETGEVIWTRSISEYTGIEGDQSRAAPAVVDGIVYLGDMGGDWGEGARMLAVDAETGDLVWSTVVDDHPRAHITQSPMVYDGVVYQGVASVEFIDAGSPDYDCCTFRGSLVAMDAATGEVLWQSYTVPDNGGEGGGYSGASIWGGTPVIDPEFGLVYATTGNNYSVPQEVHDCQEAGGTPGECMSPDNHVDSVLAFDMETGQIVWGDGPEIFDAWNLACIPGLPPDNCPNAGPDHDFGAGPQLFTAMVDGEPRKLVGAGQKSGQYWALDAATGEILWSAAAGPGGLTGGIEWGTATDGERIYVAQANSAREEYELPNGEVIDYGSFAALDPATGEIEWQIPDPSQGSPTGAVTTANGVVYAGSQSGRMFAMDAATGEVLWDFEGEGISNAGPAVVDGTVYWGNGYPPRQIPSEGSPATLYAFSVEQVG